MGDNDMDTGGSPTRDTTEPHAEAELAPGPGLDEDPSEDAYDAVTEQPASGTADRWVGVLLPIKAFQHAKVRLASALDPKDRAALARQMATTVVKAAGSLAVSVVCDDDEVATWAVEQGAEVIWRPGRGLNAAVTDGVEELAAIGYTSVIVAHADLPHALHLEWVADFDGVTLVPDRREDGTNVACVPARSGFRFSYGPGSFARHRAEAERLGLPLRIERERRLGWDVDVPDDLAVPSWLPAVS